MGKFIVHGTVVEEPKRTVVNNGIDCITVLIEEKFRTASSKDVVNYYSVQYIGKLTNCIPAGLHLVGAMVIATGTIRGREYNGRFYNDLSGDTFTIIDVSTFNRKPMPEQASTRKKEPEPVIEEENAVEDATMEEITDVPDDDLPF